MQTALQIPETFQDVYGLGGVKVVYPVKKFNKWGSLAFAFICAGGAGLSFLWGIWYTFDIRQRYGLAAANDTWVLPLIATGVLGLLALLLAWSAYSNWRRCLAIYTSGFAYSDRKGVQSWRWEEVESVTAAITRHYTNGVYTGTTHIYTLKKKDGSLIKLNDGIQKIEEAAGLIREGTLPLIYEAASQAYNAGQTVTFGPVSINRTAGLQVGKKVYPWAEVGAVKIQTGFIQVSKKGGGWFSGASVAAASVPNLEVMLSIVDQIVGVAAK